jgi:hypothetical protein
VRKARTPRHLLAQEAASAAAAAAASSGATRNGVPRLNASHHALLQWPEFGYLLDKLAAAAAAARRAGRGVAAAAGAGAGALPAALRGAEGPATAALLDWRDAAAAEAAEAAALAGADEDGGGAADGELARVCSVGVKHTWACVCVCIWLSAHCLLTPAHLATRAGTTTPLTHNHTQPGAAMATRMTAASTRPPLTPQQTAWTQSTPPARCALGRPPPSARATVTAPARPTG